MTNTNMFFVVTSSSLQVLYLDRSWGTETYLGWPGERHFQDRTDAQDFKQAFSCCEDNTDHFAAACAGKGANKKLNDERPVYAQDGFCSLQPRKNRMMNKSLRVAQGQEIQRGTKTQACSRVCTMQFKNLFASVVPYSRTWKSFFAWLFQCQKTAWSNHILLPIRSVVPKEIDLQN